METGNGYEYPRTSPTPRPVILLIFYCLLAREEYPLKGQAHIHVYMECSHAIWYSTGQRQRQNETRSNAFGGQLKRVCVHHAQIMEGTVERSKHDFY